MPTTLRFGADLFGRVKDDIQRAAALRGLSVVSHPDGTFDVTVPDALEAYAFGLASMREWRRVGSQMEPEMERSVTLRDPQP